MSLEESISDAKNMSKMYIQACVKCHSKQKYDTIKREMVQEVIFQLKKLVVMVVWVAVAVVMFLSNHFGSYN